MKYRNTVKIDYTNWRGERRKRNIIPMSLCYSSNQYHPDEQWLMEAMDLEDNYLPKMFAIKDIHSWEPQLLEPEKDLPAEGQPKEPQNIKEWQTTVLKLAKEKGFHTGGNPLEGIWKMLGNLHGEVSEAWELARMPDFDPTKTWRNEKGKLEGFPAELADIVIRAMDTAEIFGIDLQAAMWEKHQYNMTRPHRHGGKRA